MSVGAAAVQLWLPVTSDGAVDEDGVPNGGERLGGATGAWPRLVGDRLPDEGAKPVFPIVAGPGESLLSNTCRCSRPVSRPQHLDLRSSGKWPHRPVASLGCCESTRSVHLDCCMHFESANARHTRSFRAASGSEIDQLRLLFPEAAAVDELRFDNSQTLLEPHHRAAAVGGVHRR